MLDMGMIQKIIPHRAPMLMLRCVKLHGAESGVLASALPIRIAEGLTFSGHINDKVVDGNVATGSKLIRREEVGFLGHFPSPIGPVLPGVQQLHLCAELTKFLHGHESKPRLRLSEVKCFRFQRQVVPNDLVKLESKRCVNDWFEVRASVGDESACSGKVQLQEVQIDQPIMSAELLIEATAQLVAVVGLHNPENRSKLPLFGGIKSMRILRDIPVGEELTLDVWVIKTRGPCGVAKVAAYNHAYEYVLYGEISFAVQ